MADLLYVMLRLWGNLKRSLDMAMQLVSARTPNAMKRATIPISLMHSTGRAILPRVGFPSHNY